MSVVAGEIFGVIFPALLATVAWRSNNNAKHNHIDAIITCDQSYNYSCQLNNYDYCD